VKGGFQPLVEQMRLSILSKTVRLLSNSKMRQNCQSNKFA